MVYAISPLRFGVRSPRFTQGQARQAGQQIDQHLQQHLPAGSYQIATYKRLPQIDISVNNENQVDIAKQHLASLPGIQVNGYRMSYHGFQLSIAKAEDVDPSY